MCRSCVLNTDRVDLKELETHLDYLIKGGGGDGAGFLYNNAGKLSALKKRPGEQNRKR